MSTYMPVQDALFLDLDESGTPSAADATNGQFRLSQLQVVNWGTFDGYHSMNVPRRGLLITGESGSGKSSLLDAMSTIMVSPGLVRFNAAANEATKGDRARSIVSYIRGAYRNTTDPNTMEIRTDYLRAGRATWSAVAMTWDNGSGKKVSAIRLFHLKGGSVQADDVTTAWLVYLGSIFLPDVAPAVQTGIDRKALARVNPEIVAFTSYAKFAARLRREIGLGSQTAQLLLHRAMFAKNLRSLDDLLRQFMLDEPGTFDDANRAVEQFKDLSAAHEAVVDADRQIEVLKPLEEQWRKRQNAQEERDRAQVGLENLDILAARVRFEGAKRDLAEAKEHASKLAADLESTDTSLNQSRQHKEQLQATILAHGGTELKFAHKELERLRTRAALVDQVWKTLVTRLGDAEAQVPTDAQEFAALRSMAQEEADRIAMLSTDPAFVDALDAQRKARELCDDLTEQIISLNRRHSRVDRKLVLMREQVAEQVGVPAASLPFAAELADVNEPQWRGAIERLTHSFMQTMAVPEDVFDQVAWVIDQRDWHMLVLLQRVDVTADFEVVQTNPDAACRKIKVATGPFAAWMQSELASRFPHVCVLDSNQIGGLRKALTINGLVREGTRYRKDDRTSVNDQSRWIIGTDNKDLIELKRAELDEAQGTLEKAAQQVENLRLHQIQQVKRRDILVAISQTTWESVDKTAAERDVALANEHVQRVALEHPDLAEIQAEIENADRKIAELNKDRDLILGDQREAQTSINHAEHLIQQNQKQAAREASGGEEALEHLLSLALKNHRTVTIRNIDEIQRELFKVLNDQVNSLSETIRNAETHMLRVQARFKDGWPGAVTNVDASSVESGADFLAILDRLKTDGLPKFRRRFFELLRDQSQSNLGGLRRRLRRETEQVQKKIQPINASLLQTPYNVEQQRWLQIDVKDARTSEVKEFNRQLEQVSEGAFSVSAETDEQAEKRFLKMQALLTRLGSEEATDRAWQRRVLDTRLHLKFVAHEQDAKGQRQDVYEDSSGRSGGQGQKLVTFCLAAALRYQLADAGERVPRYATVVLDEAFDKTDVNFTKAGLSVFETFNFQLVLATPLKMLQTISHFVGGAVTVHNPSGESSGLSQVMMEREPIRDQQAEAAEGIGEVRPTAPAHDSGRPELPASSIPAPSAFAESPAKK